VFPPGAHLKNTPTSPHPQAKTKTKPIIEFKQVSRKLRSPQQGRETGPNLRNHKFVHDYRLMGIFVLVIFYYGLYGIFSKEGGGTAPLRSNENVPSGVWLFSRTDGPCRWGFSGGSARGPVAALPVCQPLGPSVSEIQVAAQILSGAAE